jgi:hypothetical protein
MSKKIGGRPPGATSFTPITYGELRHYCGDKTLIQVSRIWLEAQGANFAEIKTITDAVVEENTPKIEFKVTRF